MTSAVMSASPFVAVIGGAPGSAVATIDDLVSKGVLIKTVGQYKDMIQYLYIPRHSDANFIYSLVSDVFGLLSANVRFTIRVNHRTLLRGAPYSALPWDDIISGRGGGFVVHQWEGPECEPLVRLHTVTMMLMGMACPTTHEVPISPTDTVMDLTYMASNVWLCDPKSAIIMHTNKQLAAHTTIKDLRLGPQTTLILYAPVARYAIDLIIVIPGRLIGPGLRTRQSRQMIRVLRTIGASNLRQMVSDMFTMEQDRLLFAIYKKTLVADDDLTKLLLVSPTCMEIFIRFKPKPLPPGHFILHISYGVHARTIISHIHETVADVIHNFSVHNARTMLKRIKRQLRNDGDAKTVATSANRSDRQFVLMEGTVRLDPSAKIIGFADSRNLRMKLVKMSLNEQQRRIIMEESISPSTDGNHDGGGNDSIVDTRVTNMISPDPQAAAAM